MLELQYCDVALLIKHLSGSRHWQRPDSCVCLSYRAESKTLRTTSTDGLNRILVSAEVHWLRSNLIANFRCHDEDEISEDRADQRFKNFGRSNTTSLSTIITNLSADLSDDLLIPPSQIELAITPAPGKLNLEWNPIDGQASVKVFNVDPLEASEKIILEQDLTEAFISIPSSAQTRAWDRELIRVEVCNISECFSSNHTSLSGLVEGTVQRMNPTVFTRGERFAESIAVNHNGSILAVASPLEGVIYLYSRVSETWVLTQTSKLPNFSIDEQRKISLSSSANGDVVVALVHSSQNAIENSVRIFERLGEAWLEHSLSLNTELRVALQNAQSDIEMENQVVLSEDGSQLLLTLNNSLYTTYADSSGWSSLILVKSSAFDDTVLPYSGQFHNDSILLSASANHSLSRLFTVKRMDQAIWLSIWNRAEVGSASPSYTNVAAYEISAFNTDREIIVKSNATGDKFTLAGWEPTSSEEQTPIMWRYQIPPELPPMTINGSSLMATDSLRFPDTAKDGYLLRFDTDNSLNAAVLGWQNEDGQFSAPDAAMLSYVFDVDVRRWIPKLDLPAVFPTLAKQSFLRTIRMSGDGQSLFISIPGGQSLSGNNLVGEVIAFH